MPEDAPVAKPAKFDTSFDFGFNALPKSASFRKSGTRQSDRIRGTSADSFKRGAKPAKKGGKGGGS